MVGMRGDFGTGWILDNLHSAFLCGPSFYVHLHHYVPTVGVFPKAIAYAFWLYLCLDIPKYEYDYSDIIRRCFFIDSKGSVLAFDRTHGEIPIA